MARSKDRDRRDRSTITLSAETIDRVQQVVSQRLGRQVPADRAVWILIAESVYHTAARRDDETGGVVVFFDPDCGRRWVDTDEGPFPIPPEILELNESLGLHVEDQETGKLRRLATGHRPRRTLGCLIV
jgi:hypothetical protein